MGRGKSPGNEVDGVTQRDILYFTDIRQTAINYYAHAHEANQTMRIEFAFEEFSRSDHLSSCVGDF